MAKEFVACQIKEPGVLILSPFTGAGETMHEALLVNPLEETGLADTIHRALTMPLVSIGGETVTSQHFVTMDNPPFWLQVKFEGLVTFSCFDCYSRSR